MFYRAALSAFVRDSSQLTTAFLTNGIGDLQSGGMQLRRAGFESCDKTTKSRDAHVTERHVASRDSRARAARSRAHLSLNESAVRTTLLCA